MSKSLKTILWTLVAAGAGLGLFFYFFKKREVKATVTVDEGGIRIGRAKKDPITDEDVLFVGE